MNNTRIFLSGCSGRMGKVIAEIVADSENISIVAGSDFISYPAAFPIFPNASENTVDFDVIIDFSNVSALSEVLSLALTQKKPVVFCTTGFSEEDKEKIQNASKEIPVFFSGNMSLGVNLLLALSKKAAAVLYPDFDIEIIEAHHNQKVDAPSGTALMIADAVNEELDKKLSYVYERQSVREKREKKELGIHSIRGGSIVGEHSVIFAGQEEMITLSHSAQSRNVFARGAIVAARFMKNMPAGLYTMEDLIGK